MTDITNIQCKYFLSASTRKSFRNAFSNSEVTQKKNLMNQSQSGVWKTELVEMLLLFF